MAVSWSQFMRQITSNFGPFPNVALYSRAVLVILPWLSRLVPTICSHWYDFSASSINSSPVIFLISGIIVVNPGWAKVSLLLHGGKYAKYVQFAKYAKYVKLCKICIIYEANKNIPWTASQSVALASFRRVCNIMDSWTAGPWLVFPPWPLIQSLCPVSGASQLILILFPYLTMSPAPCRMLWFFSVAMMLWPFLLQYGNTTTACVKNLQATKKCQHCQV